MISKDVLSVIVRAYAYQSIKHLNLADEMLILFEPMDYHIYPLSMEKLKSLHNEFVKLLDCCFDS